MKEGAVALSFNTHLLSANPNAADMFIKKYVSIKF